MRLAFSESVDDTRVEIRRQDCPNQTPHHEVGERTIASADAVARLHQIKQHNLPEFSGCQQVFDNKREVLTEAVLAVKEPGELSQPRLPLARLDALWWPRPRENALGIEAPGDLLNGFSSRRNAGPEQSSRTKQNYGRLLILRAQQGSKNGDRLGVHLRSHPYAPLLSTPNGGNFAFLSPARV